MASSTPEDDRGRDGDPSTPADGNGLPDYFEGIRDRLLQTMVYQSQGNRETYLGFEKIFDPSPPPPSESLLDQMGDLAAAYTANLMAYTSPYDAGNPQTVNDYLLRTSMAYTDDDQQTSTFVGLEPQPFLVEALVAHVISGKEVQLEHCWPEEGCFAANAPEVGSTYRQNDPSYVSTIIVIQVANPFDVPVNLNQFALRLFDSTQAAFNVNLGGAAVAANSDDFLLPGEARNFYSIDERISVDLPSSMEITDYRDKWVERLGLDIDPNDGTTIDVLLSDATDPDGQSFPDDLSLYAFFDESDPMIELLRVDDNGGEFVVDRMDPNESPELRQAYDDWEAIYAPAGHSGPRAAHQQPLHGRWGGRRSRAGTFGTSISTARTTRRSSCPLASMRVRRPSTGFTARVHGPLASWDRTVTTSRCSPTTCRIRDTCSARRRSRPLTGTTSRKMASSRTTSSRIST